MTESMSQAWICDAIRTPIGRQGGVLSSVRPDDLAASVIRALVDRHSDLNWAQLDDVIFGCTNQAGEDNRNIARMATLLAGLPETVSGVTVNRLCASGLEAVSMAARAIKAGEGDLFITGGVESMSRAPFILPRRDGKPDDSVKPIDTTLGWRLPHPKMESLYGTDSMPQTGENVAEQFNISREDQDAFAYRSQMRVKAAKERGFFNDEIIPVSLNDGTVVSEDEHPRPNTSIEALAGLKPFVKEDGTITAGNASGINDGAAALLIASDAAVSQYHLKPLARIVHSTAVGLEPRIMGMGPVTAVQRLLAKTGLELSDIDLIELNEAFASQAVAVLRGLGLPDDAVHVNPNGGAIALGHPLGMTGARLVTTASRQLEAMDGRYAICTLCIGVGQGMAMLIERKK